MLVLLALAAMAAQTASPSSIPRSVLGTGYLADTLVPVEGGPIPAPPAAGSAADARDVAAMRAALAARGTPRWAVATTDADLTGDGAITAFSCAAGVVIGKETTPRLYALMRRTMSDLGRSTGAVKARYRRPRPFMTNGAPTCTPEWEARLRQDGSYPSGHSAVGYGFGLILAELLPDRAPALVARGRAFGDSRRICNVHWLSDVEEGRIAGATVVARLNADRRFAKDLAAARRQLAGARALPQGCPAEAAALADPS